MRRSENGVERLLQPKPRRSLGTRISLGISVCAGTIFLCGTLLTHCSSAKMIAERAERDLMVQTALTKELIGQLDISGRNAVIQLMGTFKALFPSRVEVDDRKAIQVGSEDTPAMRSGGVILNNNETQVDEFSRRTGGRSVATLFVRRGDDFIRAATSLKKGDGTRALGTKLDHTHPAYRMLLNGRSFTGKASLFGNDYMTQYDPLLDEKGKTIGSYFIGFQISDSMQSLKNLIRSVKVGKTGFLFILDGNGNAIVHPHYEGKHILAMKTSDGREMIREMIAKKEGMIRYLWSNGERGEREELPMTSSITYYKPWDWVIGASVYTHELLEESTRNRTVLLFVAIFGSMAVSVLAHLLIRHSLVPIHVVIEEMQRIGQGKVDTDVDQKLCQRKDELGSLGQAMQAMIENLRSLLRDITNVVQTLANASSHLTSVSAQTSSGVVQVSNRTNSVAAAAEEASSNTTQVAQNINETTKNLSSIADATSQLSTTIQEISGNSEKARLMTDQANVQAQSISSLMQQLGDSAEKIGKITETITRISAQTNLLALNATIEAARAGTAGKGFAVVANEIKELAQQTAAATEDIKSKISSVQNATGEAITDIQGISNIIKEVVHLVSNIAAAIEQQSAVTKDLAANINRTSSGVCEASDRVSQTATVSSSIAKEVSELSNAVSDIRLGGQKVDTLAEELKKQADELTKLTQRFDV